MQNYTRKILDSNTNRHLILIVSFLLFIILRFGGILAYIRYRVIHCFSLYEKLII